jgi:hypothetical protein
VWRCRFWSRRAPFSLRLVQVFFADFFSLQKGCCCCCLFALRLPLFARPPFRTDLIVLALPIRYFFFFFFLFFFFFFLFFVFFFFFFFFFLFFFMLVLSDNDKACSHHRRQHVDWSRSWSRFCRSSSHRAVCGGSGHYRQRTGLSVHRFHR